MLGLLKKDYIIIKKQYHIILLFSILAIVNCYSNQFSFTYVFTTFLCINIGLNTITYDQSDNSLPFLFTLPIKRSTYVKEKYLLILTLMGASIVYCVTIHGILALLLDNVNFNTVDLYSPDSLWSLVITSLVTSLVYSSIIIPLYLKFGSEKARMLTYIVVITIFILALTFSKISGFLVFNQVFNNNISISTLTIIILFITSLIFFVSSKISKKVMVI